STNINPNIVDIITLDEIEESIQKVCAQRLVRAFADHKDSRIIKLFDENEDVIDHFYKIPCPFYQRIKSLKYNGQNLTISPCQRRYVAFYRLARHLRLNHKISNSLTQKLVNHFKKTSNKK
ncbi:unnamed protein product, partial [Rotaria sp. Silwood1]